MNAQLLVCNYSMNNMIGQPVYKVGAPASDCPYGKSKAHAGLCVGPKPGQQPTAAKRVVHEDEDEGDSDDEYHDIEEHLSRGLHSGEGKKAKPAKNSGNAGKPNTAAKRDHKQHETIRSRKMTLFKDDDEDQHGGSDDLMDQLSKHFGQAFGPHSSVKIIRSTKTTRSRFDDDDSDGESSAHIDDEEQDDTQDDEEPSRQPVRHASQTKKPVHSKKPAQSRPNNTNPRSRALRQSDDESEDHTQDEEETSKQLVKHVRQATQPRDSGRAQSEKKGISWNHFDQKEQDEPRSDIDSDIMEQFNKHFSQHFGQHMNPRFNQHPGNVQKRFTKVHPNGSTQRVFFQSRKF